MDIPPQITKQPKLLVIIQSAYWDNQRRENAVNICNYFNNESSRFNVPCKIFNAYDIRNVKHFENDTMIKNMISQNFLSKEYVIKIWEKKKRKNCNYCN